MSDRQQPNEQGGQAQRAGDADIAAEMEFDRADLRLPFPGARQLLAIAQSVPRGAARALAATYRHHPDVPDLCPTPAAMGSVVVEEMMMAALQLSDRIVPGSELAPALPAIDQAAAALDRAGYLDDPLGLFPEPARPEHVRRARRSWNGMNFGHTWFPSSYRPPAGLPGRDEYLADEANRTVHMYVLRHDDKPRPYVVFLHPHQTGEARDVFLFGSAALYAGLGVNVVHPVLPLHGRRRSPSSASYPSPDALTNLYACTQAIHDVRAVLHLLRQRDATAIAVHGYSLGGYTAALLAGVTDGLDCVIAGAATTNLLDVTLRHAEARGRRHTAVIERLANGGAAALSEVVSPLRFAPRLPRERRFVLAAIGDGMVHPEEPLKLWRHWDECELEWLHESHMTGLISPAGQRFTWRALRRSGFGAH